MLFPIETVNLIFKYKNLKQIKIHDKKWYKMVEFNVLSTHYVSKISLFKTTEWSNKNNQIEDDFNDGIEFKPDYEFYKINLSFHPNHKDECIKNHIIEAYKEQIKLIKKEPFSDELKRKLINQHRQ